MTSDKIICWSGDMTGEIMTLRAHCMDHRVLELWLSTTSLVHEDGALSPGVPEVVHFLNLLERPLTASDFPVVGYKYSYEDNSYIERDVNLSLHSDREVAVIYFKTEHNPRSGRRLCLNKDEIQKLCARIRRCLPASETPEPQEDLKALEVETPEDDGFFTPYKVMAIQLPKMLKARASLVSFQGTVYNAEEHETYELWMAASRRIENEHTKSIKRNLREWPCCVLHGPVEMNWLRGLQSNNESVAWFQCKECEDSILPDELKE